MTRFDDYDVEIRPQARKSLALRMTPEGLVALIPQALDPDGEQVRRFIERGLARLPVPEPQEAEAMTPEELRTLVNRWAERLDVIVARVQIREMRTKWASCSSHGTLTLNTEILTLPRALVDYVLVHELLHLKFPGHGKGWQAMMAIHLPDWQDREARLMGR